MRTSNKHRTQTVPAILPSHAAARSTCVEHVSMLAPLAQLRGGSATAPTTPGPEGIGDPAALSWSAVGSRDAGDDDISCHIEWPVALADGRNVSGGEAFTQAISGLMEVHGRDRAVPRRLGLDVVAAAAGNLGAVGVLAALIARRRGRRISRVVVSPVAAGLLLISHHITTATCADRWQPPAGDGPGPPFPTSDGHWVEIEALGAEQWFAFWQRLGADEALLGASWLTFAFRQNTAMCALPPELHRATSTHSLREVAAAAEASAVAWCRVRDYGQVVTDMASTDSAPWALTPYAGAASATGRGSDQRPECNACAASAALPLEGLRVVELTTRIQGPLAGTLLRMLGAEVTKVEPPGGDPGREVPPLAGGAGSAFVAYNHGKGRVELDYKHQSGRATLTDHIADADIFLHNLRAGRAEELALGYDDVARLNPGLVYAHASGWGVDPPPGLPQVATDPLVQAHVAAGCGLNPAGEAPFPSRVTIADAFGGIVVVEAIVGALSAYLETGRGALVDTSLLSSALAMQAPILRSYIAKTELGRQAGRPIWTPVDTPIRTSDGYIVVEAPNVETLQRLAEACGAHTSGDAASSLLSLICERLEQDQTREWERRLVAAGVPCAAVCMDLGGLQADLRVRDHLVSLDGACLAPASPWRFID